MKRIELDEHRAKHQQELGDGGAVEERLRAAHSLGVADLLASGYSQTPIRHISPLKRQLSARVRRESSSLGRASSSLRMGAHGERL